MTRKFTLRAMACFLALSPMALYADPVIYLSTFNDNHIYQVFPDGSKAVFGPTLDGGSGLVFDQQGNLYASIYNNGTILKIAPNGSSTTFATGLVNPYGMVFDSSGNLYAANSQGGSITKITSGGVKSTFASGLTQPLELAIDASNNIYSANPSLGTVVKITTDGVVHPLISGLSFPNMVAFDASGDLYVADSPNPNVSVSILKYDANGNFLSTFVPSIAYGADDIMFGLDGNMYVTNYPAGGSTNGSILKITPGGTVSTYASGITDPTGLAIPVPEPTSLALLSVSAVLLLQRRRRVN